MSMKNSDILWVDDDSPTTAREIEGFRVFPVQSCRQAEEKLKSGKLKPSFVVMDLILPQDGWGKEFFQLPGLKFIEYLKEDCNLDVVVYTIVADEERRLAALASGAADVYEKRRIGLPDMLREAQRKIFSLARIGGDQL